MLAIVDAVKAKLPEIRAQLPPSIRLDVTLDRSESIRAAVHDVQTTLIIAAFLVVAVIFVFLRTVSATFIASMALPITVMGTFGGMALFGYNLDNLSLLALTLCVGFVVDDAIVMLENITRHVEAGEDPFAAALTGSREVGFTILVDDRLTRRRVHSDSLHERHCRRLLHEFAVTIAIAIILSGVVSVTLTPMLCSLMLKPAAHEGQAGQDALTASAKQDSRP